MADNQYDEDLSQGIFRQGVGCVGNEESQQFQPYTVSQIYQYQNEFECEPLDDSKQEDEQEEEYHGRQVKHEKQELEVISSPKKQNKQVKATSKRNLQLNQNLNNDEDYLPRQEELQDDQRQQRIEEANHNEGCFTTQKTKNLPKTIGNNFQKWINNNRVKIGILQGQNAAIDKFVGDKEVNKQASYSLQNFKDMCKDPVAQGLFLYYLKNQAYLDFINSKKIEVPNDMILFIEIYTAGANEPGKWNSHHNVINNQHPIQKQQYYYTAHIYEINSFLEMLTNKTFMNYTTENYNKHIIKIWQCIKGQVYNQRNFIYKSLIESLLKNIEQEKSLNMKRSLENTVAQQRQSLFLIIFQISYFLQQQQNMLLQGPLLICSLLHQQKYQMKRQLVNRFLPEDDSYNRYEPNYLRESLDQKIELANEIDQALVETIRVEDVKSEKVQKRTRTQKPKIQVIEIKEKKIKKPKNLPKQVGNNFRKYLEKIPNLNQALKTYKDKKVTNYQSSYSLKDFKLVSLDPIGQRLFINYLNTQAFLDLINSKKENNPLDHIKYLDVYASGALSDQWNSHHNQIKQSVNESEYSSFFE